MFHPMHCNSKTDCLCAEGCEFGDLPRDEACTTQQQNQASSKQTGGALRATKSEVMQVIKLVPIKMGGYR